MSENPLLFLLHELENRSSAPLLSAVSHFYFLLFLPHTTLVGSHTETFAEHPSNPIPPPPLVLLVCHGGLASAGYIRRIVTTDRAVSLKAQTRDELRWTRPPFHNSLAPETRLLVRPRGFSRRGGTRAPRLTLFSALSAGDDDVDLQEGTKGEEGSCLSPRERSRRRTLGGSKTRGQDGLGLRNSIFSPSPPSRLPPTRVVILRCEFCYVLWRTEDFWYSPVVLAAYRAAG